MKQRTLAPAWRVLLCLMGIVLAATTWYATRTVRPPCAVPISSPPVDLNGRPLLPIEDWKQWSTKERTDTTYWMSVGAGRCKAPEKRWHQWFD